MYANTTTRIKFSNGLSVAPDLLQNVESNKGMLLAPLFKNCIDDIVKDLVTGNCDPVRVGDLSGNCLLYADDIVLLSESKSGLQSSLNILGTYCSNGKLQVNVEKSSE